MRIYHRTFTPLYNIVMSFMLCPGAWLQHDWIWITLMHRLLFYVHDAMSALASETLMNIHISLRHEYSCMPCAKRP